MLAKANVVAFDKTGTLTHGNFAVTKVYPETQREKVLQTACLAEQHSNHPIAVSICNETQYEPFRCVVEEIAGQGICAKGANSTVLCGNAKLMTEKGVLFVPVDDSEGTVVYVAENGKYIGAIVIADQIKEDSAQAVRQLKEMKCQTVMLTGDNEKTAQAVADKLQIDKRFAQLLPQDKAEKVSQLVKEGNTVAFVGDGINDAPVLATASVGIAMGAMGSDAAIEAADIVLMQDNPTAIPTAKKISKKTLGIVKQNIVFSIAVKVAVLVLSAVGLLDKIGFGMIVAILADVGVCMIAILNSMRAMIVKKDKRSQQNSTKNSQPIQQN